MESIFADRVSDVPRSFIREILKVTVDPETISFAGGLPSRDFFPINEIKAACDKVLDTAGKEVLQYSTSEGHLPLRQFIAGRYFKTKGLKIDPDEVLITNGSQQGLDLLGKTFLNECDSVIIEKPGYLGAIQAFSIYRANFHPVPLYEDGPDVEAIKDILRKNCVKLFYAVPNFQNPTGISYSEEKRKAVAEAMKDYPALFIEDDPYGELRFMGKAMSSIKTYLPENTVLLGSFSKIVVPSFRLGWLCARKDLMDRIIVAKQASDLHTDYFAQRIVYQYLIDNDIDAHISEIRVAYKKQRDAMVRAIKEKLPAGIRCTEPEGGMFLWMTLPEGVSSLKLFDYAIEEKVAFVPGNPFYAKEAEENTLRLNFTNADEKTIDEGIGRLARAMKKMGM